jgi:hypothetical protein
MGGQALWDLQGYGIGQEASVVLVQNYFVGDRATGYKVCLHSSRLAV